MSGSILFVTGASGAGKTTAVEHLTGRAEWDDQIHFFDSVGVPSPDDMTEMEKAGRSWQRETIALWVERLAAANEPVAILEGQMRPSWILAELLEYPSIRKTILLLDCTDDVREHRLVTLRGQPDLASEGMFRWAAYLKGQADALDSPVLDTSVLSPGAVADEIARHANALA